VRTAARRTKYGVKGVLVEGGGWNRCYFSADILAAVSISFREYNEKLSPKHRASLPFPLWNISRFC